MCPPRGASPLPRNLASHPHLSRCRGAEFEALYNKYEASGKARKTIKAQKLWFAVIEAQTETGTPYLLYKDACNSKSNQQVMCCGFRLPRDICFGSLQTGGGRGGGIQTRESAMSLESAAA